MRKIFGLPGVPVGMTSIVEKRKRRLICVKFYKKTQPHPGLRLLGPKKTNTNTQKIKETVKQNKTKAHFPKTNTKQKKKKPKRYRKNSKHTTLKHRHKEKEKKTEKKRNKKQNKSTPL